MDKKSISQIEPDKNTKSFGFLPDGKEVFCYTLRNKNGAEFSVINYGATVTSLILPTASGKIDVVLGFDTLEDYIASFSLPSPPYLGTTVGRTAGRINNAQFRLNGKIISLHKNLGNHNIHGGTIGFSRKYWELKSINAHKNPSVTLGYVSEDGEENFPGELTIEASFTITEADELVVSYQAITSEDTVVNLTQHLYFNLEGHAENLKNQKLEIRSEKVLETTTYLIPTGNFMALNDHPFDFLTAKDCPETIDTTFVLADKTAAVLLCERTGLKMTVATNQPAVHVYVGGNCFNQITGKEQAEYHSTSGICFETQNFPDAPNNAHFPSALLKKGELYHNETTFKFETN